MMRLDRFLAESGLGTRSEVKKMISRGLITVDGMTVKDAAIKVDENTACVCADSIPVKYTAYEYYLLNKPRGVISASKKDLRDPSTPCVVDLISSRRRDDLFPVGRLDKDTEGLLLITNDGKLAHALLSPAKHVNKTYYVMLDGVLTQEAARRIEAGVDIGDDKPTLPCRIEGNGTSCRITIHEGRFHQVKRMFESQGLTVVYLKRLSMGKLSLGDLKTGEYREISREDIQ